MSLKHAEKYYKLKNMLADTPSLNSGKTQQRRHNRPIRQADQSGLKFQDYYLLLCYTMCDNFSEPWVFSAEGKRTTYFTGLLQWLKETMYGKPLRTVPGS